MELNPTGYEAIETHLAQNKGKCYAFLSNVMKF